MIQAYSSENDVIFDPFCGSGVTLLQSVFAERKAYGYDINPLALLIAKSKTAKYSKGILLKECKDLLASAKKAKKVSVPEIKNIDFWYLPNTIKDLGKIRHTLSDKDYKYMSFFVTCFAYTCRNQSLTKLGEFKRFRIKDIQKKESNVWEVFDRHLANMIDLFCATSAAIKSSASPILANSETKISPRLKYDLVVTSPPYGDSRTTVAYGQYSSFGLEWVRELNCFGDVPYKVDNECLGKPNDSDLMVFDNDLLQETIEKIKAQDPKRAQEVLSFFSGYYKSIVNTINNLSPKGTVCYIVGNRTVKGHQIPMDQITASFLQAQNLRFKKILVRQIHNKVMPSRNSPTNIRGKVSQTMHNEYIVIFTKERTLH